MQILDSKRTNIPLKNLENYLKYKYEIFIQIDENKNLPIINDPYFFHKLDISNYPIVEEIYIYLELQFRDIIKEPFISHRNLAILFKKFSDGFIESYIIEAFDTKNIIDTTLDMFLNGVIKDKRTK